MDTTRKQKLLTNNLENNPKTGRTNSATKGREEATSKKVGSVESWSGRETDHGRCSGEEATVAKGER